MKFTKKGYTFIEIVTVVLILVLLSGIVTYTYTGFLNGVKDTSRKASLSNLQTLLDTYVSRKVLPMPENKIDITSTGGIIAYQGYLGEQGLKSIDFRKGGTDPKTGNYFTYYVTKNRKYFQLMGFLEERPGKQAKNLEISNKTYATDYSNLFPLVYGYKLGILTDLNNTPIQEVPSIITAGSLNITTTTGIYYSYLKNDEYVKGSGAILNKLPDLAEVGGKKCHVYGGYLSCGYCKSHENKTNAVYTIGIPTKSNQDWVYSATPGNCTYSCLNGASGNNCVPIIQTPLVDQTNCNSTGWQWISPAQDINIGTTTGSGFCISPTIDFVNSTGRGISWNGWSSNNNGWNITAGFGDTDISNSDGGQTRDLIHVVNSTTNYTCSPLGTATVGLTLSDSNNLNLADNPNSTNPLDDTLFNRMRYIAKYRNSASTATALASINWISSNAKPSGQDVFPALHLSDCLDGTKDLGTDLVYKHSDNSTSIISYSSYNILETTTKNILLSNSTFQNRQKYLLARTQKRGSHLPSAYSSISSGTAGSGVGEYEKVCTIGGGTIAGTNDDSANEWIWLANIGKTNGDDWGFHVLTIGSSGCSTKSSNTTSSYGSSNSARFVVRP